MSATDVLVSHLLESTYEGLPGQVLDVSRKSVLDTLAVAIAGSTAVGSEKLAQLAKEWGGREESTILVFGGRIPSPAAALVNATIARALDFDDVHEMGVGHVNAVTVPSAFVLAEYAKRVRGKTVSGRDFILALALGNDQLCRIRIAAGKEVSGRSGWTSETFAAVPVAAMGAKMLGFDREKTLNAMGIAYAQCAGNIQGNFEGALTARLQQGLAGQAGVLSVVLADIGWTGAKDMLEGKYGLYPLYFGGDYDPNELIGGLGERWEGNNVSIKPYPCCKYTHGAISGTRELVAENRIDPASIKKITISTSTRTYYVAAHGENKTRPRTVPDSQFSYQYAVAAMLTRGKLGIEDFTIEAIKDPRVLALAQKVNVVIDKEKDKVSVTVSPTDIEIETVDGRRYSRHVDRVKGHPLNPMSWDEVVQKLRDCSRFSAKPLSASSIDGLVNTVGRMEQLEDATEVLKYLG